MRLSQKSILMFAVVGAAVASVAAVAFSSLITYRNSKDSFASQLGTDIDQIGFNVELILQAEPDAVVRQKLLYPLLERYLLDDRFKCLRLTISGTQFSVPPSSFCATQSSDEIISLELDADEPAFLVAYIDYREFNEVRLYNLFLSGAVVAVCLCSFGSIAFLLFRESSRLRRQEAEQSLNAMLDASPVLMLELAEEGIIKHPSRGFQQLCADLDVKDTHSINSVFEDSSAEIIMEMIRGCSLNPAIPLTSTNPLLIKTLHRPRGQLSGALSINPLALQQSYLLQLTDISAVFDEKEHFAHLLQHDFLTGAFSIRALQDRFCDGIRQQSYGILVIDIDYFKSINDTFGHVVGDHYLQHAVQILWQCVGKTAKVFRLSGEEFLVLDENADVELLMVQASKICHKFAGKALTQDGYTVLRTVSIGASILHPKDQLMDVMRAADSALLQSKSSGKNRVAFASYDDFCAAERRRPSVEQLEAALESGEIDLYLEQVFNTKNQQIIGFETLLRWNSASGLIPPMEFLENYYYATNRSSAGRSRIDLLRLVLARFSLLSHQRGQGLWISYNVALSDFDDSFLPLFESIEPEYRSLLVLEISEQMLGSQIDELLVAKNLHNLSALGYRIALDDFGVDGSNLSRLSLFPVDIVKLDKSLIRGIDQSEVNQSIIRAVRLLATALGIELIAEGVETRQESLMLDDLGINLHQGFLYGRAVPAEQARDLCNL